MHLVNKILENLSVSGIQVCALDYSLALDRLIHNVIIKKLIDCYFPPAFVEMIYSCLLNRSQCVVSGDLQGSIIVPFLLSHVMSVVY